MNDQFRHIALLLTVLFLFSACVQEDYIPDNGGGTSDDDHITVELFTRASGFNTPVATRGIANEIAIDRTLWVLVFKGDNNNATFVEAAETYTLTGINKTYVNLTPQTVTCKLLILANPQDYFYLYNGSSFDGPYSTDVADDKYNELLAGKTLAQVCAMLYTEPLAGPPQTASPFVGASIPMSIVHTTAGISTGTTINDNVDRAVAKIVAEVDDSVTNFELSGIAIVGNVPQRGLLHNLDGTLPTYIPLIDYYTSDPANVNIADVDPGTQSTAGSPIYLYESNTANGTYIIIKGTYSDGKEYFYKMAIVATDENFLPVLRNREYTFTITAVKGRGYDTYIDAMIGKASNIDLDYEILVVDPGAYEIIANNDYYLAVSNSIFVAYKTLADGEPAIFDAFTVVTDCTRDFVDSRYFTTMVEWGANQVTVVDPADSKVPIAATSANPVSYNVSVEIPQNSVYFDGIGNTINGIQCIAVKLGNLQKNVFVKQTNSIDANGSVFQLWDYWRAMKGLVTGSVTTEADADAQDWIKLSPTGGNITDWSGINNASNLTVTDGVMYIHVLTNTTGSERTGIVYFTCNEKGERSDWYEPVQGQTFRVKASITQLAQ